MNRKAHWLAAAALLPMAAFSAACLADDYRLELQGGYSQLKNPGDFPDQDALWAQGRWFFAPVNTDGVPLAEAAFLGRSSYLGAGAARYESYAASRKIHLQSQGASVGYYIPDTMFFAGAAAQRSEFASSIDSVVSKDYDTHWNGVVGITPLDGLLLTTQIREDGYDPNITARYVGKLPNGHWFASSVSVIDPDQGDTAFGVDFDYYFDDTFSAGIAYRDSSESVTGKVRKFFTPRFSVGAAYTNGEFSDSIDLDVAVRF